MIYIPIHFYLLGPKKNVIVAKRGIHVYFVSSQCTSGRVQRCDIPVRPNSLSRSGGVSMS